MNLQVSSSPHIRDNITTQSLMRDVVIACIPAIIAATVFMGLRAFIMILLSILFCTALEYIARKIMKRNNTLNDFTAIITGILLAFNLPPNLPIYMLFLGCVFAIIVIKQMFGGLGNNFINPALGARIFLTIAFPNQMTAWVKPEKFGTLWSSLSGADLISSATPRALATGAEILPGSLPSYWDLFLGQKAGSLGEISILALSIGALYLLVRKVITPWIPLVYICTTIMITTIAGKDPLFELLTGGLFLGAFFMATDYVTSPVTRRGRIIFALGCGIITAIIRLFGNMVEGVSFSIILMNILTPHIDKISIPKIFGEVKTL